jgi:hypothetical protein
MFGRRKRTDAQGAHTETRNAEAIITAATEPVLPPPPPAAAPLPPPPAPSAPSPSRPAPSATDADELSSAEIRARTLLADSIARMELSLKVPPPPAPPAGLVVATSSAAVEALADSVARTASEVARALEHVSSMCALLSERLDADREERRALTEAIARLGVTVPTPADAPSTVLGGTVFPAPESEPEPAVVEPVVVQREVVGAAVIELESAPVIALLEDDPEPTPAERPDTSFFASPPAARARDRSMTEDDGVVPSVSMFAAPPPAREPEVAAQEPAAAFAAPPPAPLPAREPEVISLPNEEAAERAVSAADQPTSAGMWCRDDDQWIGGVEIADFVSDNGTIRYWLRRTSDGQMLPRPFDATDLRFVRETASAD